MKKSIGILGGMGPLATADLLRKIENQVREHFDIPIITRSEEEADALTPVEKPTKKR